MAPALLLCAAAALAGFPTLDPAYVAEPHTAFNTTSFSLFSSATPVIPVFACAAGAGGDGAGISGASITAPWVQLNSTMIAAGAALQWLPQAPDPVYPFPPRPAQGCYAEAAMWVHQKRLYPGGLRTRGAPARSPGGRARYP